MKIRQPRVVPSLVAVTVAVVVALVALAGSAQAAKLITGKAIKNGSITSVDVRNNNLTGADLKNSSVSGADLKDGTVTGADVADGSISSDDLDSSAMSTLYTAEYGDLDIANCPDQTLSICPGQGLASGSGSFLVTVTGTVDTESNSEPTPIRCGLVQGGTILAVARFAPDADDQPGDVVPFSLTTAADLGDGDVAFRCTQFAGDDIVVRDLQYNGLGVGQVIY